MLIGTVNMLQITIEKNKPTGYLVFKGGEKGYKSVFGGYSLRTAKRLYREDQGLKGRKIQWVMV